jgi:oligopeptide transport system permease protein
MATTTQGAPWRGALLAIVLPRGRWGALALYVVRRVLWMVPVLLFVVLVTFGLMHIAPGSPWDQAGRPLPAVIVRNLDEKFGLDKPVWQQLLLYVWNIAHLDFGLDYQYQNQTVGSLLLRSWPYTLTVGGIAFLFVVPTGITLGVIAALRQNTWIDYLALGVSLVGATVPGFVIGMFLIILLSVTLNRWTEGFFFLPTGGFGLDHHLIMPVLTLSALPVAFMARLTRASTLEVMRHDFVRTAWAKGLTQRLVVLRHVLKNSLVPVVTALGPIFAFLVTGSVIVETVFSIPGIGRSFVGAVSARDYPMILATTILYALVIAVANLIVDILYVFIDPRVRLI